MKQYTDIELMELSNNQIKDLFFEIRSILFEKNSGDIDTSKNIEIYLCYITREIENRDI
jgi:hypothetical protein